MAEPLLSVRDLCVDYLTETGPVRAVDRVSFDIAPREVLGLTGESGSGKSTLAQALLRVLPPPAAITGGEVRLEGRDLLRMSEVELRSVRWRRIAVVFQGALDALCPVLTVEEQIVDALVAHGTSPQAARARAAEQLRSVGLSPDRLRSYPHQLSGGMRQRVAIAMALALRPALLVLDEPTTALDLVLEREILARIAQLQQELGFAVLFITHDLTRMLQLSHRVGVLHAARLVEIAPAAALRDAPRHPYTQALLRAVPAAMGIPAEPAAALGTAPSLRRPPSGCRFHPRCDRAVAVCRQQAPALAPLGGGAAVACHRVEK